jgi:large subunit ribosomal protein L10
VNKEEKEQIVSDLRKRVERSKAIVLTSYRGLKVDQVNGLRNRLREEKLSYHVVKNTLIKIAARGTALEKLNDYFEGPTAIVVSYGDPISLAKVLMEFVKTLPTLEIKAGMIEGRMATPEGVKALATMPSREALIGQVLGEIQTPGGQLGAALLGVPRQVLYVLQARVDQLATSSVESGT